MNSKTLVIWVLVLILLGGAFLLLKSKQKATTPTTSIVTPTPAKAEALLVTLNSVEGSPINQSGTAVLSEQDGKVKVTVGLSGDKVTNPQPIHIHTGSCGKPGEVVYPLSNVVNGKSETVLDVDLATLQSKGTLINVHKSSTELKVYTSCGEFAAPTGAMEDHQSVSPTGVMKDETPSATSTVAPSVIPTKAVQ